MLKLLCKKKDKKETGLEKKLARLKKNKELTVYMKRVQFVEINDQKINSCFYKNKLMRMSMLLLRVKLTWTKLR